MNVCLLFFFYKRKTAYELRISDWSSDVSSSDLLATLLSRPYAGRIIDNLGSKRAVMFGLAGCGLSGVFMLASAWTSNLPTLSLISLQIGRESCRERVSQYG